MTLANRPRSDALARIKRVIRYAQSQPAFPSLRSINRHLGLGETNPSVKTNLLPWMLKGWDGQVLVIRRTGKGYELTEAAAELAGKDETG